MPRYRVENAEPQANGQLYCDTFVEIEKEPDVWTVVGHFTVVIQASDVLALSGLTTQQRIAGYKALFFADERISKITDSENAADQLEADLTFPLEVGF